MADHFYIVYPTGQNAGSTLYPKVPTSAHIISTPVGSPEDNALRSGPGLSQLFGILGTGKTGQYQGLTNFAGPFDTQQQALNFHPISGAPAFGAMLGAGLAGVVIGGTGNPGASNLVAPAANAGAAAASGISGLFQGAIWLRVAEVALGIILLAVGIAKLTNAVPIATKVAGVVA
ncbi:MAG: hypothetical protein ACRDNK_04265 [Solirubrobacteraceae bacterium]